MSNLKYSFLLFLLASLVLASCSRNPVTGKREVMFMSESQEINLGKQSDPSIVAQYGLYEDAKLQKFIDTKGQQMAKISHRPDLNYDFKILNTSVVNAFAVPGGFVYFTRGILAHFNNEAEFAGVLGHEIGHITARHSAKQYSKQMLLQGLFVGGLILSDDFRNFADVASQGLGLLFLKYGRDAESQSDKLGVEYSTEIGYDAGEMANFFNTLSRMRGNSGQSIPEFMSTHPDPVNRYENVKALASKEQKRGVSYQVNRDQYLRMIDGIIYGEDPREGYIENQVFYHPELKFSLALPNGWQYQNSPSQFQMGDPNGKAMMVLGLENAANLQAAQQAIVERNRLRVIEQNTLQVNGLPALTMLSEQIPESTGQQQTAQDNTLKLLTYIIQYSGNIYKIHGVSAKNDFNSFFSTFRNTMQGFTQLTDPSKLNKQPTRISIVPAKKSGTIVTAIKDYGMGGEELQELLLLNGMQSSDQVAAGMLIKVFDQGRSN